VTIADDFDNLTRGRGDRPAAMSPAEALRRMSASAGLRYDPVLLQLLVNHLGRYPPGTMLLLADGRIVISTSTTRSAETWERPLGRVVQRADGTTCETLDAIDLALDGEIVGDLPPA
jgi:HD-GYP domain-containing protein (c-di-GMP phosphodiesterase class II)